MTALRGALGASPIVVVMSYAAEFGPIVLSDQAVHPAIRDEKLFGR
jgi:hypothetical protein